jgi:hypothetical protein
MKKFHVFFGFVLFLILVLPSSNQEYFIQDDSSDEEDLGPGVSVLSIPPCALQPNNFAESYEAWYAHINKAYLGASITSAFNMMATVYLPHKAKVKKLAAYVIDNSTSDHIIVSLFRIRMDTGTFDHVAHTTTQGGSDSPDVVKICDDSISYPDVGNYLYSYALEVYWTKGANDLLQFRGAKIIYEE